MRTHICLSCREVDLPDDVFTDDVSAKVDQRKLTITIARRDPEGPAMQVSDSCETHLQAA